MQTVCEQLALVLCLIDDKILKNLGQHFHIPLASTSISQEKGEAANSLPVSLLSSIIHPHHGTSPLARGEIASNC